MNQEQLHERILYPVVRVRTEKAGGSGTVIYSEPDAEHEGDFLTFVLTNWHVVEGAITTKKEWDSLLKRDVKRDVLQQVNVELFDYVRLSVMNSANVHKADIVAYDKNHDLAVLKLDSPKQVPWVAKLIAAEDIEGVKLFTPVWASGCSLGHDPFANPGYITYLKEDIENRLYWMTNANSIFGNSGGAVFLAETGEQVGVTARVTGLQLGFGVDIMTWMNFCVSPQRLYEFFDEQELQFLYDSEDTYEEAMKRREKKQKRSLLEMLREGEDE